MGILYESIASPIHTLHFPTPHVLYTYLTPFYTSSIISQYQFPYTKTSFLL